MKLTPEDITTYNDKGYLFSDSVFDQSELNIINDAMSQVINTNCPNRILENNGSVRSFFDPGSYNRIFEYLTRLERLITPATQLVGGSVYVHQTKINSKFAMAGDWWDWHQDFTFWNKDDGMPKPSVVTAMIYLTECNEFNGPLLLIPGSHRAELLEEAKARKARQNELDAMNGGPKTAFYMSALTTDLKYTIGREDLAQWITSNGIESAKGPAGSVLWFHGNVFHASSNNLSAWDRHVFLITYNSIHNSLPEIPNPRPAFIANRIFDPISPVKDDILFSY